MLKYKLWCPAISWIFKAIVLFQIEFTYFYISTRKRVFSYSLKFFSKNRRTMFVLIFLSSAIISCSFFTIGHQSNRPNRLCAPDTSCQDCVSFFKFTWRNLADSVVDLNEIFLLVILEENFFEPMRSFVLTLTSSTFVSFVQNEFFKTIDLFSIRRLSTAIFWCAAAPCQLSN